MNKVFIVSAVVMLLVSGCAGMETAAPAYRSAVPVPGAMAFHQDNGGQDRMIIKRVSIDINADDVKKASGLAEKAAIDAGGMVQEESSNDGENYIVLKVPAEKLDEVLQKISFSGDEQSRRVSKEDVTAQVADNEAVLKTRLALRDRLRQLLGQTKDVKDVIAVESELARVQGEIDSMEAVLKTLKGQVDMSEITVNIRKKIMPGPLGWIFMGIWWVVGKLFVLSGV
jgi:outer membrane translocation and assembly module TamA